MPKFRFIVQAKSGKARRGTITEADEQAARHQLESAGFQVVSLIESTDLVVHTPAQGPAGRKKHRTERAAIIDFEETAGEKIGRLLNTYFLRREAAMILAVAGLIWIATGMFGGSEPPKPEGPTYVPYVVTVEVTDSGFEPDQVEVRLPDIPFKVAEPWDEGPSQKVVLDFEAAKQPDRVEITFYEDKEKVGYEEGHLSSAGSGKYTFSSTPMKMKKP